MQSVYHFDYLDYEKLEAEAVPARLELGYVSGYGVNLFRTGHPMLHPRQWRRPRLLKNTRFPGRC